MKQWIDKLRQERTLTPEEFRQLLTGCDAEILRYINKKNIALLRACAKTGKAAGQFIEVMACEGGCITGPSTHNDIVSGRRQLAQELLKRKESYETMDR